MKKILVGLTVLALMLTVAGSVSATWWFWGSDGQTVEGNSAFVTNNVTAVSKTGGNTIYDHSRGSNTISTGSAYADALASNMVNSNLDVGCCDGDDQEVDGNRAWIMNDVTAVAKTGGNTIYDYSRGSNTISTGNAYASAWADNMVNSNEVDGCCGGGDQEVEENCAFVNNDVTAVAKTGRNTIYDDDSYGGCCWWWGEDGNNVIRTGPATSYATSFTTVNSNIQRGY